MDAVPVPPEFQSDLARLIADFAVQLAAHADRAVAAARDGRARDAFLAAGAMQELLNARVPALRVALAAMQSKRTHPAVRAEIRKVAALVPGGVAAQVRALESAARARQARLDAIGEALRASTASRTTYSARGFVRPTAYAPPGTAARTSQPAGWAVKA